MALNYYEIKKSSCTRNPLDGYLENYSDEIISLDIKHEQKNLVIKLNTVLLNEIHSLIKSKMGKNTKKCI